MASTAAVSPVWFITGCSTGLGRALAQAVLHEGHRAVVTAREPARVRDIVANYPATSLALQLDVANYSQIEKAVAAAEEKFGRIDVLVNNAGYGYLAAVEEGEEAEIRAMFETNFFGLAALIRRVLPGMRARAQGHIINISSVGGLLGNPSAGYYNATKFAVKALTEGINLDVAGTPIRVSSVDPGFVETEFSLVRFHGDAARAKTTYQGFRALSADDVADTISYVVNLPEHVNILDLILVPSAQRSVHLVDRK